MSEENEATEIQEAVAEAPPVAEVPPDGETTKVLETGTKPKKPRSAAQVAAFAKAREKLAEKRAAKEAEKAAAPPPKRGRPKKVPAKKVTVKKEPQYVLQSSSIVPFAAWTEFQCNGLRGFRVWDGTNQPFGRLRGRFTPLA